MIVTIYWLTMMTAYFYWFGWTMRYPMIQIIKKGMYRKDKCEVCRGAKGGIPGNENIHYVSARGSTATVKIIACDYCSSEWFS